ncbi:MAG: hypothetical protein M1837_006148 [Sclerophora amabilis]|nr:MAG: hypothetical protein M1837_006148 [Sclerophora amabilis]
MLLLQSLFLLAALTPLASADIEFTSPAAGASVPGGDKITVQWKDSGSEPSLSDLKEYTITLMTGSNEKPFPLIPIATKGKFTSGNKASGTIEVGIGASKPANAYFFQMLAVGKTGGQVINYSDRFSLTGMTGNFPPEVVTSLKSVKGTTGPKAENQIANGQNQAGADAGEAPQEAGPYKVPYTLQTGLTRYAPMQPKPGTKITEKDMKRLWPTSGYTVAKTYMKIPTIQTTLTQSASWTVKSRENTAEPAPHPTDDMERFLARWKD